MYYEPINCRALTSKDYLEIWSICLRHIAEKINPRSFKTWFEPIKPIKLESKVLTIQVPNKFFYEWLEEHYIGVIGEGLRIALGPAGRLEYQIVVDDYKKVKASESFNRVPDDNSIDIASKKIKNPFVIPGLRRPKVDPQLKPSYTFENFIEGDCNRLARSAGLAIAKKPGGNAFNPLFIFGDVGLGKTHLAQAIGNEIITMFDDKNVIYVSSEKLTNQIVHALKSNSIDELVNFYQMIDVLIVDDIQFLANRPKTQEIFFHIFNHLHQIGNQIILTSDRPPKDLNGMQDRLISRFKWGISADLVAPDFETKLAIAKAKIKDDPIRLPEDVLEFICYNIKTSIRELEGVLITLIAQSALNNKEIDIPLTKEVIKHFIAQMSDEVTVESISKLVAEHFEVPLEKLHSKTRKRSIVIARQLSMYLAKLMTNKSLKHIGNNLGGRDHTTVLYACRSVQNLMDTDQLFKDTVFTLEKKIRMSLHSV